MEFAFPWNNTDYFTVNANTAANVLRPLDFIAAAKLDMDLFELEAFCEQSKIGQKVGRAGNVSGNLLTSILL